MRCLTFVLAILLAKPLAAEEIWACRGFLYSDGSSGNPFVLRGDGQTYQYADEVPWVIEHVADNLVNSFRIYVNTGRNTYRNAYYLREAGNRLTIRMHYWELGPAETDCFRQ